MGDDKWLKTYLANEFARVHQRLDNADANHDLLLVEVTKLKTLQKVSKKHRLVSFGSGSIGGAILTLLVYLTKFFGVKI